MTKVLGEQQETAIRESASRLYAATRAIRVLTHVSWPARVREKFLAGKGRELPNPSYPEFDPTPSLSLVEQARSSIGRVGDERVRGWLNRTARQVETGAKMLAACGSPDFFRYGSELYGRPDTPLDDGLTTSLDLAAHHKKMLDEVSNVELGEPPLACHLATEVVERMKLAITLFGDEAPEIQIVEELSANALAGPRRVRIRRTACFTDLDLDQLVEHEIYVHVATSLNGMAQTELPILGAGHPGTTKTQEGLAVFAEVITGRIDLDRLRRLSDRVIAVQMAIDGADFIDVYNYFLALTASEEQAFESARRVFRGGVLTGGAPFTKDIVYLDGLLRVHNFLKMIVSVGRADCLTLLFCGKLAIEDLPALAVLRQAGLCREPKYLPPWASDRRHLLSYLGYTAFLTTIDLTRVTEHYRQLVESIPSQ